MALKFTQISEKDVPDTAEVVEHPAAKQERDHATDMLMLALGALSKRAVVAFSSLFTLLTVGSAFWVWMTMPDPDPNQLIALGMYGLFVLAINIVVFRRK